MKTLTRSGIKIRQTLGGYAFTRGEKSYVIKKGNRFHYRFFIHEWPLMVQYPEVVAKGRTMQEAIDKFIAEGN